jgi:hypothetical protein
MRFDLISQYAAELTKGRLDVVVTGGEEIDETTAPPTGPIYAVSWEKCC